jgi:aldehyde dehydrogenase (NAD+)
VQVNTVRSTVQEQTMTDTADRTEPGTATPTTEGFAELVDGLRATFRTGRTRPIEWRREQLGAMHRMLVDHEDDFVEALRADLGRPPLEAYAADIGTTKAEIKHALKHVASWAKPKKVNPGLTSMPAKAKIIPEPLGTVLIIAPWNYPIQLLLNPMAAAIAAGNCIVAKPSELAPACSAVLARLVPRYLDNDAITLVEGGVPETTALLELPYDHVFFTGSTAVGRVVMQAAAKHLTPVTLELGGKSPTIVAADADLGVAAHRILWGKHLNAAQTCIAPDYVLVESSVKDRLVDEMASVLGEFLGRDPQASPDFGRIVNDRHFNRLTGLLESAGGTVAVGGSSDAATRFIEPTIIVDPDLEAPIMQEEIFGPLLPVVAVDSIDDAIDFVNDRPKPLALYVFAGSPETAEHVLASTSSGGACVNQTILHINTPNMPFGGVGPSGTGSYHGKFGFDAFSHHKSVLLKPQKPDPKLLYPPYTPLKDKIVHAAL